MRNWATAKHVLLGVLLLMILPLIMRTEPILTPFALDRIAPVAAHR